MNGKHAPPHDSSIAITIITHFDYQYPTLSSLPSSISSFSLPPISLSDLAPETRFETRIATLMARSIPFVHTILQDLKSSYNLVAFVTNLFGNKSVLTAKEVGVPHYMFFTSNLFMLSFMFQLPALDEATSCEYCDLPGPLKLPGCVPLRGEDFMSPLSDKSTICDTLSSSRYGHAYRKCFMFKLKNCKRKSKLIGLNTTTMFTSAFSFTSCDIS